MTTHSVLGCVALMNASNAAALIIFTILLCGAAVVAAAAAAAAAAGEGGIREPGFVRWPGHIKQPGRTSWDLVTTYDIFPTVIALAGGEPPAGKVLDGRDLSATLLHGAASPHRCLFHWHDSSMTIGLAAVRCGDFKAHFATTDDFAAAAQRGLKPWPVGVQDPPLLFNLSADASETQKIDPTSTIYATAMKTIRAARQAHLASIVPVCSQNKGALMGGCGGNNISMAVCSDPASPSKYPKWPACTINPEVWEAGRPCV